MCPMWILKRTLELEPKLSLNKYIFSHEKIVSQIEHFGLDNIYETEEINYLVRHYGDNGNQNIYFFPPTDKYNVVFIHLKRFQLMLGLPSEIYAIVFQHNFYVKKHKRDSHKWFYLAWGIWVAVIAYSTSSRKLPSCIHSLPP